eukprot:4572257-Prymnesium_polylepis.1
MTLSRTLFSSAGSFMSRSAHRSSSGMRRRSELALSVTRPLMSATTAEEPMTPFQTDIMLPSAVGRSPDW